MGRVQFIKNHHHNTLVLSCGQYKECFTFEVIIDSRRKIILHVHLPTWDTRNQKHPNLWYIKVMAPSRIHKAELWRPPQIKEPTVLKYYGYLMQWKGYLYTYMYCLLWPIYTCIINIENIARKISIHVLIAETVSLPIRRRDTLSTSSTPPSSISPHTQSPLFPQPYTQTHAYIHSERRTLGIE